MNLLIVAIIFSWRDLWTFVMDNYYPPMIMFNLLVDLLLQLTIANYQLFEDGSFVINGCLPWAICAIQ